MGTLFSEKHPHFHYPILCFMGVMKWRRKKLLSIRFGCKVNLYETNGMAQKFEESEYEVVDFSEKADIYIVNTCTVTSIADKKSRQFLRQAKKNNPNGIVIAVRMLCSSC